MGNKAFLVLALAMSVGCASKVKKADIAATADPAQEIERLEGEIQTGYNNHLDVLAPKDFTQSQKSLEKAKDDLKDGEDQEDILEQVAYSQGYLAQAQGLADHRRTSIEGVMSARTQALQAGVQSDARNRADLKIVDDDLRSDVDNLNKLSAQDISAYQRRYLDLELAAIKSKHLGQARARIEGVHSNAKKYAPQTLRRAEVDLKNAENEITSDRRNSGSYSAAVARANASSDLLVAVLDQNKQAKWRLDEATALRLVNQNREIAGLERKLNQADATSQVMGETIEQQNKRLRVSSAAVRMQRALDSARKEFADNEAEVYQQGDKLLIRLKAINFKSGSSELPQEALPLLSKVREVANELGPQAVMVEGHTDSVGSAAINSQLSQDRAEAVATYFGSNGLDREIVEAVGLGFKKPIASNKTADGRAVNRRVDVIITPKTSAQ